MGRFYKTQEAKFVDDNIYNPNLELEAQVLQADLEKKDTLQKLRDVSFDTMQTHTPIQKFSDQEVMKLNDRANKVTDMFNEDPNSQEAMKELDKLTDSAKTLYSSGPVGQMARFYQKNNKWRDDKQKSIDEMEDGKAKDEAQARLDRDWGRLMTSLNEQTGYDEDYVNQWSFASDYYDAQGLLDDDIDDEKLKYELDLIGKEPFVKTENGEVVPISTLSGYIDSDGSYLFTDANGNPTGAVGSVLHNRRDKLEALNLPFKHYRDDEMKEGYMTHRIKQMAYASLANSPGFRDMVMDDWDVFGKRGSLNDPQYKDLSNEQKRELYFQTRVREEADFFTMNHPNVTKVKQTRKDYDDTYREKAALKDQGHRNKMRQMKYGAGLKKQEQLLDAMDAVGKVKVSQNNKGTDYDLMKATKEIDVTTGKPIVQPGSQEHRAQSRLENAGTVALKEMGDSYMIKNEDTGEDINAVDFFKWANENFLDASKDSTAEKYANEVLNLYTRGDSKLKQAYEVWKGQQNQKGKDSSFESFLLNPEGVGADVRVEIQKKIMEDKAVRQKYEEYVKAQGGEIAHRGTGADDPLMQSFIKENITDPLIKSTIEDVRWGTGGIWTDALAGATFGLSKAGTSFMELLQSDAAQTISNLYEAGKIYEEKKQKWYDDKNNTYQEIQFQSIVEPTINQDIKNQFALEPESFTVLAEDGTPLPDEFKDMSNSEIFNLAKEDKKSPVYAGSSNSRAEVIFKFKLKDQWVLVVPNQRDKDDGQSQATTRSLIIKTIKGTPYGTQIQFDLNNYVKTDFNWQLGRVGRDVNGDKRLIYNADIDKNNTRENYEVIINEKKNIIRARPHGSTSDDDWENFDSQDELIAAFNIKGI